MNTPTTDRATAESLGCPIPERSLRSSAMSRLRVTVMAYSCRPNRLVLVLVEVSLFEGLQNAVIDVKHAFGILAVLIASVGCSQTSGETRIIPGSFTLGEDEVVVEVSPHFPRSPNVSVCIDPGVVIADPLRRLMPDSRPLQVSAYLVDIDGRRTVLDMYHESRVGGSRLLCLLGVMDRSVGDVVAISLASSHPLRVRTLALVASSRK